MNQTALVQHLSQLFAEPIRVVGIEPLGMAAPSTRSLSKLSLVQIETVDGPRKLVLRAMNPGPFGLEELEDRARQCLFCYNTYNRIPSHPKAIDVGLIRPCGDIVSMAGAKEFFLLEEFVDGYNYGTDFVRMRDEAKVGELEMQRAHDFAAYLAGLHGQERPNDSEYPNDSMRYRRALRELVGGGEGLIGIIDSYSPDFVERHRDVLCRLEQRCLAAAQELRRRSCRLRLTHGDFHPWNILFQDDHAFTPIDKSRSDLNDPAIDVGSLLMNYVMLAIWHGDLPNSRAMLLARRFLRDYVELSSDREILEVLPPFTAMRAVAVASPDFYPEMPDHLRTTAFSLAAEVAHLGEFDLELECIGDAWARLQDQPPDHS